VLSEAVFPVYIVHQTVLITLAHVLKPLNGSFGFEFFAIVCGTFAISFALYLGLRRIRWLRPWMGMRSH
jgi:glucans biosynthesis protein C